MGSLVTRMSKWKSRFWLGALLVVIGAVVIGVYHTSRTLQPTVLRWDVINDELVVQVSILNTSPRALVYAHHPFPVRFRSGQFWTNAQVVNAFRCAVLDPGQCLAVKVIAELPAERPEAFQVGTDFATQGRPLYWLNRLSAGGQVRWLDRLIDPVIQSLARSRPVACHWSDHVALTEGDASKPLSPDVR